MWVVPLGGVSLFAGPRLRRNRVAFTVFSPRDYAVFALR